MNGDDDSINTTSLDHGVDAKVKPGLVQEEQYTKNHLGDAVAKKHFANSDTIPSEVKSWTMSEIERTIATSVLPSSKQKLAQFGVSLSRRNDFRLRDLSRKLGKQTRLDFDHEITKGPLENRVREFDIQSQSMRLISANASLGTYQFQRTQVLPYMRKSLALGYEKVNLLKKVVGALGTMESAIVSKLEAIKINTAACTPYKPSLFARLKMAVRDKNVDRVAGNISNLMMSNYDAKYKKFIAPSLAALNERMSDTGPKGGVNGVTGALSRKLNSLRHTLKNKADADPEALSTIGRIQQSAAKAAAGVLSTGVKLSQKAKLSLPVNSFVAKHLSPFTEMAEKFQPFAPPPVPGQNVRPDGTLTPSPFALTGDSNGTSPMVKLADGMDEWRKETKGFQKTLLEHLGAIRQKIAPTKKLEAANKLKTKVATKKPKATQPSSARTLPSVPKRRRITTPRLPRIVAPTVTPSVVTKVTGAIQSAKAKIPRVPKIPTAIAPVVLTAAAPSVTLTPKAMASVPKTVVNAAAAQPPVDPAKDKKSAFSLMMGSFTKHLDKINSSIQKGDSDRTKHEQAEDKRQGLLEKLANKAKIRKGSYEDQQNAKGAKRGFMPWGRKAAVGAAAGAAAGGASAAGGGGGWKIPSVASALGSGAMLAGKGAMKYGWKGTKLAGKLGWKGATKAIPFVGRMGGKGLLGALKLGGKGALKFGKSGFGVGLAAAVGKHYFDKSGVKGTKKRVGDSALDMVQYGAIGASIGAMFGGIGAIPGAAIGAGVGLVVANADYAAKALKKVGDNAQTSASGLLARLFGEHAIIDRNGKVLRQERLSVLGELKSIFYGKKARYSSSGELIAPEHMSLVGSVKYGFQKLLFGDKFSNGEYKQGTSIIDIVKDGVSATLKDWGQQMRNMPSEIKKGWTKLSGRVAKAAGVAKDATVNTAKTVGGYISDKASKAQKAIDGFGSKSGSRLSDLYHNFSMKKLGTLAKDAVGIAGVALYSSSPTGFSIGASNAIFGWSTDSGLVDNPTSPFYAYATQILTAYGIKNRGLFKFIHSLEMSQDRVNNGQAKPFDDNDMAYMSGRFGFDSKNKESVDYFKLWYKRRFIPAMTIIGKVLRAHRLTFGSVMSASEKEMLTVVEDLKKELGAAKLNTMGLEPTPQAYNKYAKIGGADPGGVSASTLNATKSFDPRDPKNRNPFTRNTLNSPMNMGSSYNNPNASNDNYTPEQRAARANARIVKGGVKDQPDFKAAYAKLPPHIKKMVDKSKALQFVLWSTAVQHGGDQAALIFQRDYSSQLDEKGYIKSIYQDRSTRFGDVGGEDRAEALAHLNDEQRKVFAIANGTSNPDIGAMGRQISNVVDPNGGYDMSGVGASKIGGSIAKRANLAIRHMMSKGYSKNAAVGIVANLIGESGLDPNIPGDGGRAIGLAQWHPDRQRAILQHFNKPSMQSLGFYGQLDAVDWELRGNGKGGVGAGFAEKLNSASSVGGVVQKMVYDYERPKDKPGETRKRTSTALGLLKNLGNDAGNAPAVAAAGGGAAPAAGRPAPAANRQNPGQAAPQKAAPKPKPKTANPANDHADPSVWAKAVAGSLDRHTEALNKSMANQKPNTTHNSFLMPTQGHPGSGGGSHLSMSMRKAQIAVGE